jgi:hypothetical protein
LEIDREEAAMVRKRRVDEVKQELWRKRVEDQARSGLTIREFCRREGLSEPGFYGWRRELVRRDAAASQSRPLEAEPSSGPEADGRRAVRFARVIVSDRPRRKDEAASSREDDRIEIETAGGRRIRVGRGFDPAALREVLAVVERESLRC